MPWLRTYHPQQMNDDGDYLVLRETVDGVPAVADDGGGGYAVVAKVVAVAVAAAVGSTHVAAAVAAVAAAAAAAAFDSDARTVAGLENEVAAGCSNSDSAGREIAGEAMGALVVRKIELEIDYTQFVVVVVVVVVETEFDVVVVAAVAAVAAANYSTSHFGFEKKLGTVVLEAIGTADEQNYQMNMAD
jgi:hypothetical protein